MGWWCTERRLIFKVTQPLSDLCHFCGVPLAQPHPPRCSLYLTAAVHEYSALSLFIAVPLRHRLWLQSCLYHQHLASAGYLEDPSAFVWHDSAKLQFVFSAINYFNFITSKWKGLPYEVEYIEHNFCFSPWWVKQMCGHRPATRPSCAAQNQHLRSLQGPRVSHPFSPGAPSFSHAPPPHFLDEAGSPTEPVQTSAPKEDVLAALASNTEARPGSPL